MGHQADGACGLAGVLADAELVALRVGQDNPAFLALADIGVPGAQAEQAAVVASQRAVQVALNEYLAGTEAYTTVVTAEETLLSDQQSAVNILQDRLVASVGLIQALGGGWTPNDLPSRDQVRQ